MLSDIKYLKATLKDKDAIIKMHTSLYSDDDTKTADKISEQVNLALKNKLIWVAKIDNKTVGYVLCELFDGKHRYFPNSIFIDGLYVLNEYRNEGVGKNLVEQALQSNFPKQYTYFSVTHDPRSLELTNFYNSFGFIKIGATKAGNIMMSKSINTI